MFLSLALSEEDTGSETTAAIALQMPVNHQQSAQDRALQAIFEVGEGGREGGRLFRHRALAHMSPVMARAGEHPRRPSTSALPHCYIPAESWIWTTNGFLSCVVFLLRMLDRRDTRP